MLKITRGYPYAHLCEKSLSFHGENFPHFSVCFVVLSDEPGWERVARWIAPKAMNWMEVRQKKLVTYVEKKLVGIFFHSVGKNNPNCYSLIFFRGVQTINQIIYLNHH
jgi:hypothetical protein